MFTDQQAKEVVDRLRRLETRVTKFMEAQGFETQARRPRWSEDGIVAIPNPSCAIKDFMATIPESWDPEEGIEIYFRDQWMGTFYLPKEI